MVWSMEIDGEENWLKKERLDGEMQKGNNESDELNEEVFKDGEIPKRGIE